MKKRIIAIAVTLLLLYTIGGTHERVHSEGLPYGPERLSGEAGEVEADADRDTEPALGGDTGTVRESGSDESVSGHPAEGDRINDGDTDTQTEDDPDSDQYEAAAGSDAGTLRTTGALDLGSEGYQEPTTGEEIDGPDAGISEPVWEGSSEGGSGEDGAVEDSGPAEDPEPEPEGPDQDAPADSGEAEVEEPVPEEPSMEYLGEWTISFYCSCPECCGVWAGGATASGAMPSAWWTAATGDLPFGTILYVDGLGTFEVQDRGTEYGWLDVFVSDHGEALANGLQTRSVYIVR